MIEPSPSLFYNIISNVFKDKTTLATRIVSKIEIVEKDHEYCHSLCVNKDGIILINKDFWSQYVKTNLDATIVFLHELFHIALGDVFKLDSKDKYELELCNLSMDMRINAAIINYFLENSHRRTPLNNILERLYSKRGVYGLLRPFSSYSKNNKYALIYKTLYNNNTITTSDVQESFMKDVFKSEKSIRNALKILLPRKEASLDGFYIGNHSRSANEKNASQVDEFLKEELGEALLDKLQGKEGGLNGGLSSVLYENCVKLVKTSRSIKMQTFEKFACSAKINTLKAFYKRERRQTSVYPIRPTNRDLARVAAGDIPVLWNNIKEVKGNVNKNVAIYLDVSGSVTSSLPKILGVIKNLRKQITTVFCFSNEVYKHSMDELLQGKYKTTGGTDFNCIVKHAVDNDINKFICFSDGWADCNLHHKKLAKKHIKDVAMVYFGSKNYDNFFCINYNKTFNLDELI